MSYGPRVEGNPEGLNPQGECYPLFLYSRRQHGRQKYHDPMKLSRNLAPPAPAGLPYLVSHRPPPFEKEAGYGGIEVFFMAARMSVSAVLGL